MGERNQSGTRPDQSGARERGDGWGKKYSWVGDEGGEQRVNDVRTHDKDGLSRDKGRPRD